MSAAQDDHAYGHHGSPFVQHHYDDAQHQFDSGKFGIWLFLAQEVLFFSALFVAYILYRVHHPEIYSYAHKWLDVKFGAINTAVLIFSSLTAAWAVRAAQLGQKKLLVGCIAVTILCALTFLGIKYIEYSHKVHEHILFGRYFDPCVSPGGAELLTKGNECAGTKSTVAYDKGAGKPTEGCFQSDKIDQAPKQEGLQADCQVEEITFEFYHPPIFTASKNYDCKEQRFASIAGNGGTYTFTGACDTIIIKGDNNTVAIDSANKIVVDGKNNKVTANAAGAIEISRPKDTKAPDDTKSTVTATSGLAPDKPPTVGPLTAAVNVDQGEKSRELGHKPIVDRCPMPEDKVWAEIEHERTGKPEAKEEPEKFPCARPAYQPAVCPDIIDGPPDKTEGERRTMGYLTHSQVGFLVEYGDHEERGREKKIVAVCKPSPPPPPPPSDSAEAETQIELGKKLVLEKPRELSTHQLHELESLGPPPEHTNMFFSIYFAMTGLHGIHVLFGVFVFTWLLIRATKGHFSSDYFGPVDYAALYWHIVDLIWIFLFPLLYLIH